MSNPLPADIAVTAAALADAEGKSDTWNAAASDPMGGAFPFGDTVAEDMQDQFLPVDPGDTD